MMTFLNPLWQVETRPAVKLKGLSSSGLINPLLLVGVLVYTIGIDVSQPAVTGWVLAG